MGHGWTQDLLNEPFSLRKMKIYQLTKGSSCVVLAISFSGLCLKDRDVLIEHLGLMIRLQKSEQEAILKWEMSKRHQEETCSPSLPSSLRNLRSCLNVKWRIRTMTSALCKANKVPAGWGLHGPRHGGERWWSSLCRQEAAVPPSTALKKSMPPLEASRHHSSPGWLWQPPSGPPALDRSSQTHSPLRFYLLVFGGRIRLATDCMRC